MKPKKALAPLAKWLLRISVAILVFDYYFEQFTQFSFDSFEYFIAFAMILSAAALIIGGFMKKHTMTVVSGLIICGLSVIMLLVDGFSFDLLLKHIVPASLGFYFFAMGNKG